MHDWLLSGRSFGSIEEPIHFLKTLMCLSMYLAFRTAINVKIAAGGQVTIDTLVDTLNDVIINRCRKS